MVAMSGGVDSSVTAFLVLQQGFSALGATMRLINNYDPSPDKARACGAETDIADAKAVCARLGCPHEVLDFAEPFRHEVMERFAKAYEAGLTPNPCVDCNRYIKFGRLFQAARSENCDYIATGHYARVTKQGDRCVLQKAVDESKDQSYVLYSLSAEQLRHTMFPLGEFTKAEVRELAEENGFANAKNGTARIFALSPTAITPRFWSGLPAKPLHPAILWTEPVACSARTRALSAIQSDSGAGWGLRFRRRCMCWKKMSPTTAWCWALTTIYIPKS